MLWYIQRLFSWKSVSSQSARFTFSCLIFRFLEKWPHQMLTILFCIKQLQKETCKLFNITSRRVKTLTPKTLMAKQPPNCWISPSKRRQNWWERQRRLHTTSFCCFRRSQGNCRNFDVAQCRSGSWIQIKWKCSNDYTITNSN